MQKGRNCMGQFSWLDCEDGSQIIDNKIADVYVLVPEEFGGGHICERCYDGYGNFGGNDIYDLVADWNRKYLKDHPDYRTPHSIQESSYVYEQLKYTYDKLGLEMPKECIKEFGRKVSEYTWYECYSDLSLTREEIVKKLGGYSYRNIGIDIACYDEDNAALPFPIKITHNPNLKYEDCEPSLSDPDQGWPSEDDDECY